MSRTERIVGGAAVGYVHQAAVVAVGLWLTPFLLGHVGQHDLGIWLVTGQALGYLALMDFGVLAILPREVAAASGLRDPAVRIKALVRQVSSIVRWQMLLLCAMAAAIWVWLTSDVDGLRWPLAIVSIAFVVCYPGRIPLAVLQGQQRLALLARWQFVAWAVGTSATILLILAGLRLNALALGWACTLAIPAFVAWRRSRSNSSTVDSEPAAIEPYLRRSAWVSVSQVAQVMLSGSDILLVGRLLGPAAVVPYACTGKLVTVFANHPHLLMHMAQPALSELRASESRDRLATVAIALSQTMLFLSAALAMVILPLNHLFVAWWVGPSQWAGWPLTFAFAAMMLIRHWNVATTYTLFCFGYERQLSLCALADGIVTIVVTALATWQWGLIGAPLGSIAGAAVVSLPWSLRSVARELDLTIAGFIGKFDRLTIVIVANLTLAAVMSRVASGYSPIGVLAIALILSIVFLATSVPILWRGPAGPYLRTALGSVLWRMGIAIDPSARTSGLARP